MAAPGYGYGIVAMAALGYGGPQSKPRGSVDRQVLFVCYQNTKQGVV